MKVNGSELGRALKQIKPALRGAKYSIVRMQAHAGLLTLTAANSWLEAQAEVKCEGQIDVVVEYRDLVPFATGGELSIDLDQTEKLVSLDGKWDSAAIDLVDTTVITLPWTRTDRWNEMDQDLIITRTELEKIFWLAPMACRDEARALFCSVCIRDGFYYATDTHRLAATKAAICPASGFDQLIPVGLLDILRPLLPRFCEHIRLTWTKDGAGLRVAVMGSGQVYYCFVQPGQYPDCQKPVPADEDIAVRLTIPAQDFRRALHLLRPVAEGGFAKDRLVLRINGDALELAAHGRCIAVVRLPGEVTHLLPDADTEAELNRIAFDVNYMLDGLRYIDDSASITLELVGAVRPIQIRSADGQRRYVLMPMYPDI